MAKGAISTGALSLAAPRRTRGIVRACPGRVRPRPQPPAAPPAGAASSSDAKDDDELSDEEEGEGDRRRRFFFSPRSPFLLGEGDAFRLVRFPRLLSWAATSSVALAASSGGRGTSGSSASRSGDGLGVLAHMNMVFESFSRFSRRKSA